MSRGDGWTSIYYFCHLAVHLKFVYTIIHTYFNTQRPPPPATTHTQTKLKMPEAVPQLETDSMGLGRAQEIALEHLAQRASKQVSEEYILHLSSRKKQLLCSKALCE